MILFGTEGTIAHSIPVLYANAPMKDTDNVINEKNGGYEHVTEFIPIGKPDASTLAKLASLQPSEVVGDRKLSVCS